MRNILTGLILALVFVTSFCGYSVDAGECRYGCVHAWYQAGPGGWRNATGHPVLKPGELFQIRITVCCFMDIQVMFVKLHEFGTPVYEVCSGPVRMEQLLECRRNLSANASFSFQWTIRVRPNTSWTQAIAPLELLVQFNRNDSDLSQVMFDVVTAYILEGVTSMPADMQAGSENNQRNRFEESLIAKALLVLILLILVMKQRHL